MDSFKNRSFKQTKGKNNASSSTHTAFSFVASGVANLFSFFAKHCDDSLKSADSLSSLGGEASAGPSRITPSARQRLIGREPAEPHLRWTRIFRSIANNTIIFEFKSNLPEKSCDHLHGIVATHDTIYEHCCNKSVGFCCHLFCFKVFVLVFKFMNSQIRLQGQQF